MLQEAVAVVVMQESRPSEMIPAEERMAAVVVVKEQQLGLAATMVGEVDGGEVVTED